MKSKHPHLKGQCWLLPMEILTGIVLMSIVAAMAVRSDLANARTYLDDTVTYMQEQCNSYNKLNMASETKSLMRMMQSAREVDRQLLHQNQLHGEMDVESAMLQVYVKEFYLTGILLMDNQGNILEQSDEKDSVCQEVQTYLHNKSLLETAVYKQKSYAARVECEDGSYVDIGVVGCSDTENVLVAYYHTSKEYIDAFTNSLELVLADYNNQHEGTVVVSDGERIVASSDKSLEGKTTDDLEILKMIKESPDAHILVRALHSKENPFNYDYGLMQRGRDYYVYAFMPQSQVLVNTPTNLLYTLIIYAFALAMINMVHWKTAQSYQQLQFEIQQRHTKDLQIKNQQLEAAVEEANRANMAKTNFLSRMSHDIRTPLNGIIGLLTIDEAHPDDVELLNTNRGKIMVAANYLLSLINDILQMSKLESGEFVLSHEAINLRELVGDVRTVISQRAAESGVTLEYDNTLEQAEHSIVYGSPLHLRQIFINIYTNCVKYNKVGGRISTQVACLQVKPGTVTYRWTISDTGIGMSEKFLQQIFNPFSQEHSDARSVYSGTGLGMAIVKNLLDAMQGTIEIKSEVGVGSTFVITIPFEIAQQIPEQEKAKQEKTYDIRGLHLLLAEDNDLNAEIAQTLLEEKGAVITVVRDGQQAIDAFTGNPPGTFDAILMDVMMPVVDGLSATRAIRAFDRPDAEKIPIIAMTANAFDEDVRRCLESGMNAHLAKPLQMDKVMEAIAKYTKRNL